jgi:hypothetical protein
MRYLIGMMVFLLYMSVARAAEPRFHYLDCVNVVSGFYKGCHGLVKTVNQNDNFPKYDTYDVELSCKSNEGMLQQVRDGDLQAAPGKRCNAN